ncbi:MAG TPA: isomerase [Gammaproteobacteria bacterium]|nr:isomerase [Gammaproteobacteria bacterium]
MSYEKEVKPVLDKRCVVCHSCYDAPCQLKLSSTEGLTRGANKEKVYNPKRLTSMEPTRLFIDAKDDEWRKKGFHSVLDDTKRTGSTSLLQRLLVLKQHNPQPAGGLLPDDFTLDIERKQICPDQDGFDDYAEEHPLWGMPYAMPGLDQAENIILKKWLDTGAVIEKIPVRNEADLQIKKWETFFNLPSNKHRLTSRYIYEHLFQAHIHFDQTPPDELYRLVRSHTSTGYDIDEIATLRPYDDPGARKFYYRLLRYTPTVVAKNHIVYSLSDKRLERYRQLFIEPDYDVDSLPSYAANMTSNPFKTYAAIPPDSRYRFLLDEARFFIEGFVKGPVCRGQVALSVIEDHFWIMFFNPDREIFTTEPAFLNNMSDYLQIPSERKSHLNLLPIWTDYWQRQKQYMATKQRYFEKMNTHDLHHALSYIWNGDENNPNAALTVFRHFDSASVEYGFVGDGPETAWIIDYPLLERIHYLLVAGFNVYGNIGHQLSTRIFMDFLRMEGEDHFLAFLPVSKRKEIRDKWYQGMRSELDTIFKAPMEWLNVESVIGYHTDDVQLELYEHIKQRMGDGLSHSYQINQCGTKDCRQTTNRTVKNNELKIKIDNAMETIDDLKGKRLHNFPEVSFVRVITDDPERSFSYSFIRNKAYKNVSSLLSDERKRDQQDIEHDDITVVDWLAGSYPNFFFSVHIDDIDDFIQYCMSVNDQKSFDRFIERYGVRRTDPAFWKTADWFQDQYKTQRPLHSGLYDLSRYSNL